MKARNNKSTLKRLSRVTLFIHAARVIVHVLTFFHRSERRQAKGHVLLNGQSNYKILLNGRTVESLCRRRSRKSR